MSREHSVRVSPPYLPKPNVVTFDLVRTGDFRKAISNTFMCEYNCPIDTVPPSLLVIPLLGSLLPVVWALDGTVYIESIDRGFYAALPILKESFQGLYPRINFRGHLEPKQIVTTKENTDQSALFLFSGGVDSVASYLRHQPIPSSLVTVWGSDIRLADTLGWSRIRDSIVRFAEQEGVRFYTIRSNFADGEFLQGTYLNYRFRQVIPNWGTHIHHGFGLLSLCAPLTSVVNASTVYIPATHTKDFSDPWGSHPWIDNCVRWSNVRCVHDAYDLSRAEKIKLIAHNRPGLAVRVCSKGVAGVNCGHCEKCVRTIIGFLIAGADPNHHGFSVNTKTLSAIREALEHGQYRMGNNNTRFMWQDLQKHLKTQPAVHLEGAEEFLQWFGRVDLDTIFMRSQRKFRYADSADRFTARILPPTVHKLLKRIYVKTFLR